MKNIKNSLFSLVSAAALSLIVLAPSSLAAKEVSVNESDNGKSVSLDVHDTLKINLQGNKTTGFDWTFVSDSVKGLDVRGPRYIPVRPVMCGSPGVFVFKCFALSSCSSELKFQYARKWEKDVPPAKEFHVFVNVK